MPKQPVSHKTLRDLQRQAFNYFHHEVNPANGLVADRTAKGSPASIAATGLALAAYPVAIERGFMTRTEALRRVLATLRFFRDSRQGDDPNATGYKGFYYHMLDMTTGARAAVSELSTIDTALLLGGVLTAAAYFTGDRAPEREVRALGAELFARVDWLWAMDGGASVTHGWTPERGFLPYRWEGYSEGLLIYILGLGSETHPLPPKSYDSWLGRYTWKRVYDQEYIYAGPLFIHQLTHVWVDFRGIQDAFMRAKCIDYFENSRRATYAQHRYAIHNPKRWVGYSDHCWGISASDGPGAKVLRIAGKVRRFYDYRARGVPFGPDDGTIAPWATVASLPFAPEIVMPVLRHFEDMKLRANNRYGFKATFNMTFPQKRGYWVSPQHLGLNQGPIVLMIENFHSGLIWRLMRTCPVIVRGLRRAGFRGGWLTGGED